MHIWAEGGESTANNLLGICHWNRAKKLNTFIATSGSYNCFDNHYIVVLHNIGDYGIKNYIVI